MKQKLVVTPEVEQDLADAYAWYESQRTGLGNEFIGAYFESICRSPEMFERVRKNYRRAIVRRFPYSVFFDDEDQVTVYCVFHAARDPDKWRQRLP